MYVQKHTDSHKEFFQNNDTPDVSRFLLWQTYKAFMRGVIINVTAHMKKQWDHKIQTYLDQVHDKETLNKKSPSLLLAAELNKTRAALRDALVSKHSTQILQYRAIHYHYQNKAGRLLSRKKKPTPPKKRIVQLRHPQSNKPNKNPKDIANAFSKYYSYLYNLQTDKRTPTTLHGSH